MKSSNGSVPRRSNLSTQAGGALEGLEKLKLLLSKGREYKKFIEDEDMAKFLHIFEVTIEKITPADFTPPSAQGPAQPAKELKLLLSKGRQFKKFIEDEDMAKSRPNLGDD